MARKDDLEQSIRESYEIINQYQAVIRTSNRAEEKARARHMIQEQRALIKEYQAELRALKERRLPAMWVAGSVLALMMVGGLLLGIWPALWAWPTPTKAPAVTSTLVLTTPSVLPITVPALTHTPTPTHTLKPTNTKTRTSTPTHTPTSTGTPAPTHTPTPPSTPTPTWTPTPGLVQRRAVDYDATAPGDGDAGDHEWVPAMTEPAMGCPGEDTFAIQAMPLTGSNDALNRLVGPAVIYEFDLLPATYYLYVRGSAETTDQDAVFISWQAKGRAFPTLLTTEKGLKFKPPKLNWQPGEDQYLGQEPIEVEIETGGEHTFIFQMRKAGLVLKTILLSPTKCDFNRHPCDVEQACGVSD